MHEQESSANEHGAIIFLCVGLVLTTRCNSRNRSRDRVVQEQHHLANPAGLKLCGALHKLKFCVFDNRGPLPMML